MPDVLNGVVNVVLLLAILVVLVVIHEFGHFVTARLANVRVHEFGIGFPPRARILARDSETIYTLNWLPIGGFVRLEGEEGESQDPRSFVRQPLRTRLVILVAGVAMNFLLAWLILSLIAGLADPIAGIRVGQVQPGSPAERIGLRGGRVISTDPLRIDTSSADTIVAVDEKSFPFFDDPAASLDYLRSRAGETVSLRVRHADGSVEDLQTTLRRPEELGPDRGALGIRYLDPVPVGEIRRVDSDGRSD